MPRFFCDQIEGDQVVITGEDARHISRVLRCRVGETLWVCDMRGTDYRTAITALTPDRVTASVVERLPTRAEGRVRITLYQCLPKGDKLDAIIQKSVELGVHAVVPVLSRRCVARPDEKNREKKLQRYNKIAFEAAKQCGRGIIPAVEPTVSYVDALRGMQQDDLAILFYEQAVCPLHELLKGLSASCCAKKNSTEKNSIESSSIESSFIESISIEKISILIGCEGGFDPEEAALAERMNIPAASLGKRILRCETASAAVLSILDYLLAD